MRKKIIISAFAVALIAATAVYAANVHLIGNPTFSDNGTRLQACFRLAGLGNQNVTITVKANGLATTVCTNHGGHQAPGQNHNPVQGFMQQTFPSTQVQNGSLSVCLTTNSPPPPSPGQAGCPNGNWTTTLSDVQFTNAEIIVVQGGQVVLDRTFQL